LWQSFLHSSDQVNDILKTTCKVRILKNTTILAHSSAISRRDTPPYRPDALRTGLLGLVVALQFGVVHALSAQTDTVQWYTRVWFSDKGTIDRVLVQGEPLYTLATSHLTARALARRAKVLPVDSLVTTRDLPLFAPYVDSVTSAGAIELQRSRWFNTLMVAADSNQIDFLASLPFVDSLQVFGPYEDPTASGAGKVAFALRNRSVVTERVEEHNEGCITSQYGMADRQLRQVGFEAPHSIGISGEGVLVGILDAGFDWRAHESLSDADVVAEYDFVNHDPNPFDEPFQVPSETHGTLVMSLIGGKAPGAFYGGAPGVQFALAKTEDVGSEKRIEEDNFVAGLEWLESLGVDVTNTSLGYTTFDPLEPPHSIQTDLDGHTVIASRAVNEATRLGVISVVAAGNDYRDFRYVGVPGEADSAFAIAAVDSLDRVAGFSSRGSEVYGQAKPDFAAPGVGVYGATPSQNSSYIASQGTSLASPMATSAVALLLSARPDLRPWEVRQILQSTSSNASSRDTALGYGEIDIRRALSSLTDDQTICGELRWMVWVAESNHFVVTAWCADKNDLDVDEYSIHRRDVKRTCHIANLRSGKSVDLESDQPSQGVNLWVALDGVNLLELATGDTLDVVVSEPAAGDTLRRSRIVYGSIEAASLPGLCYNVPFALPGRVVNVPNPFDDATRIEFSLDRPAKVSLSLFSITGERVLELIDNEEMGAGFHSQFFDARSLPAGVYLYRLQMDDGTRTGTMVRY
jgi:hypothetical protein